LSAGTVVLFAACSKRLQALNDPSFHEDFVGQPPDGVRLRALPPLVMPGLVPGLHVLGRSHQKDVVTSPAMTAKELCPAPDGL
jgi:hypothetical protein